MEDRNKVVRFKYIFKKSDLFWLLPYLIVLIGTPYFIFTRARVADLEGMMTVWGIFCGIFLFIIATRWLSALDRIWNSFCNDRKLVKNDAPELTWANKSSIFRLGIKQIIEKFYTNGDVEVYFLTIDTSRNEDYANQKAVKIFRTKLDKKYPFSQALQKGCLDFFRLKPKNLIPKNIHDTESVEFNKNFELSAYTPHDAFFVFSPEVMHLLLDINWFSVEVCDEYLAIFTTKEIRDLGDYETIYRKLTDLKKALS